MKHIDLYVNFFDVLKCILINRIEKLSVYIYFFTLSSIFTDITMVQNTIDNILLINMKNILNG